MTRQSLKWLLRSTQSTLLHCLPCLTSLKNLLTIHWTMFSQKTTKETRLKIVLLYPIRSIDPKSTYSGPFILAMSIRQSVCLQCLVDGPISPTLHLQLAACTPDSPDCTWTHPTWSTHKHQPILPAGICLHGEFGFNWTHSTAQSPEILHVQDLWIGTLSFYHHILQHGVCSFDAAPSMPHYQCPTADATC
jgi:hypothetical protein